MIDRIQQTVERIAAILDLFAAIIFLALLLKVYGWMSTMIDGGLIK